MKLQPDKMSLVHLQPVSLVWLINFS